MKSRKHWTRKDIGHCGYGDQILATVHDPARCWYWSEVTDERGYFNPEFKAKRGKVNVVLPVQLWAAAVAPKGHIVIEPHVKATFSADNKDWGFERWQALVDSTDLPWIQFRYDGKKPALRGVRVIETPSFDAAVGVLAQSAGFVSGNGGLQYAAAALGVPAVIVWGAFGDPSVIGYDHEVAIVEPDPEGLGMRTPSIACRAAMNRISVDRVARECRRAFRGAE